ncbi:MAG: recombinase XerD, partial [Planctomycetota bacterium]
PKQLKLARDKMIEQGLSRVTINHRVQKIVRCFKWGVSEEFVKPEILHALKSVDGLRAGRSEARESEKVRPVPVEHIEAIRPHMNPVPMAVVDLLLLTGARVGEITSMRTCDLDMSSDQWIFTPESHKTDYTGRRRYIALGRKGMAIVREYLKPDDPAAYIFQPKEAMAIRKELLRQNRKSKV